MTAIRKAVITAGGMGTRHFPATLAVQKELFPIVDRDGVTKPVIQIVAEEAVASGIEEICIVTSPHSLPAFRAYFAGPDERHHKALRGKEAALREARKLTSLGERVRFAVQETQQGYGHAVYCARDFVGEDPFLLLLGDHVYLSRTDQRCAAQLLGVFAEYGCSTCGVARTPESQLHLFGTVTGPRIADRPPVYDLTLIREKPEVDFARVNLRAPGLPEGQYLTFFGMMALLPSVMDALKHNIDHDLRESGEFQLTSALERCREQGRFLAAEIQGLRLDMGVPAELLRTQASLALAGPYRDVLAEALA